MSGEQAEHWPLVIFAFHCGCDNMGVVMEVKVEDVFEAQAVSSQLRHHLY